MIFLLLSLLSPAQASECEPGQKYAFIITQKLNKNHYAMQGQFGLRGLLETNTQYQKYEQVLHSVKFLKDIKAQDMSGFEHTYHAYRECAN